MWKFGTEKDALELQKNIIRKKKHRNTTNNFKLKHKRTEEINLSVSNPL